MSAFLNHISLRIPVWFWNAGPPGAWVTANGWFPGQVNWYTEHGQPCVSWRCGTDRVVHPSLIRPRNPDLCGADMPTEVQP